MARKRTKPVAEHIEAQTDAALQADATAAHEQQLAESPVEHPLTVQPDPFDAAIAARSAGQFEAPPAEPASLAATDTNVGHTPTLPREEATAIHEEVKHALKHQERVRPADPLAIFKDRDWSKFADPAPIHGVHFEDGYDIKLQQSTSRNTIELQFGDGSRAAQPKAFNKIKQVLLAAGMNWNARPGVPGNAWEIELRDERHGTHAERHAAKQANKASRTMVEEQVFPQVLALEEQVRGPVELTEDFRNRIQKAVAGNGRA